MTRPLVAILVLVLITLTLFLFRRQMITPVPPADFTPTTSAAPAPVSYQASFIIVTHGTRRDFSSSRYHSQSSLAYLSPDNPSQVQVRSAGVTWQQFFDTLPMKLTPDCLVTGTNQQFCTGSAGVLRFFLNDSENPAALSREILEGDKLLVTF